MIDKFVIEKSVDKLILEIFMVLVGRHELHECCFTWIPDMFNGIFNG